MLVYRDGILRERWDDTTRTYTAWDELGVVTETRPYTTEENDRANALVTASQDREAYNAARLAIRSAITTVQAERDKARAVRQKANAEIGPADTKALADIDVAMGGVLVDLLRVVNKILL